MYIPLFVHNSSRASLIPFQLTLILQLQLSKSWKLNLIFDTSPVSHCCFQDVVKWVFVELDLGYLLCLDMVIPLC